MALRVDRECLVSGAAFSDVDAAIEIAAWIFADYTSTGLLQSYTVGTRQWTYTHDSRGRVETVTDPLARVTRFEYDGADRVTLQGLPNDSVIVFRYDAAGNLTSLKPPGRPAHTFATTPGNLTRHYDPPAVSGLSADTTGYMYNSDRQLVSIVRPDTQTVSLDYGASTGRLEAVRQASDTTSLGYDSGAGQLSTLGRSGVNGDTLTFAYDGPLLTRESWSRVGAPYVDLQYDANGWPTTQRVHGANGNSDITYHYDADGLIEDVAVPGGSLGLDRHPQNGLVTALDLDRVGTDLIYTTYGELDSVRVDTSTTPLYSARYSRDGLGRITRLIETVRGVQTDRGFTYDLLGRLVAVRDSIGGVDLERYAYDANGNRTSSTVAGTTRSATYDDQDRMLTYGSASYTYTGNGERRRRSDGSASATYTYDAFVNLKRVDLPGGGNVEYLIDGRNRRVGRKLNGTLAARWIYQNGLSPVAELDASGNITKRFVYASRGHAPDLMVAGDSTYRLITDHLGSVRLVVNIATGAVRQQLAYDAWGNVTLDTNPGFQPLGYAGGLTDTTTRLVRFGARDYEPATGRWTAKDPIGFGGGHGSFMAYAENDPVNYLDIDGTDVGSAVASAATEGVLGAIEGLGKPPGEQAIAVRSAIGLASGLVGGLLQVSNPLGAIAFGAVVGAGTEVVVQLLVMHRPPRCISWPEVGAGALGGALGGAFGAVLGAKTPQIAQLLSPANRFGAPLRLAAYGGQQYLMIRGPLVGVASSVVGAAAASAAKSGR